MRKRHSVGGTQALAASVVACLALLCVPAVSAGADPSDSSAEAPGGASELLASGAGYGQPQGESQVRALQRRLRALGHRPGPVDGRYGPSTEAAVERLQRDSGLSVDGMVGPQTRRVLNAESPPLAPSAGYGEPAGSRQVRAVQRQLHALGQRPGPIDGLYGPRTQAAVERFQRSAGQTADGVLSRGTATSLARAGADQSAQAASKADRRNESRQQGRSSASGGRSSTADDGPAQAGVVAPADGSDRSKTRSPAAVDDRSTGSAGGASKRLVLLLALALVLEIGGIVLVRRLGRRRRKPEAGDEAARPVRPPLPTDGTGAATNGVGESVPTVAATAATTGVGTPAPGPAVEAAPTRAGRRAQHGGAKAAPTGAGRRAQHGGAKAAPTGAAKPSDASNAPPNDARKPAKHGARQAKNGAATTGKNGAGQEAKTGAGKAKRRAGNAVPNGAGKAEQSAEKVARNGSTNKAEQSAEKETPNGVGSKSRHGAGKAARNGARTKVPDGAATLVPNGAVEPVTTDAEKDPDNPATKAPNGAGRPETPNGAPKPTPDDTGKAPNGAESPASNGAKKKASRQTAVASAHRIPEPATLGSGPAALGYVSVREPDSGDEHELQHQTAAISTACRDRGLVLKEVIRDREQVDASGPAPPGMQYALRRLAAGDASCLVVAELGRLSRSTPRIGYILEWLRRTDARFVAVGEGLDTGTKSGNEAAETLVSSYLSAKRRQESARLRQPARVPDPVAIQRAGGRSARPEAFELKLRIREMRESGMTLQAIANRLNEENVPTLRGGATWRPSAVQAAAGYRRPAQRGQGERRPDSGRKGGGAR
jgi:peptidoglycan hydrolase-like protein with peptidoglycan-binding domain/DNA invertase Pin-like site-specific DNA recombinase